MRLWSERLLLENFPPWKEGRMTSAHVWSTGVLLCPLWMSLPSKDQSIQEIKKREMGVGWEEAGTLVPTAASVLWELAHEFPEFPHINFRTSPRNQRRPRAEGRLGASAGSTRWRGRHEGKALQPGLVSQPGLVHGKVTGGTSQGQAPCRVRAQATSQKVLGPAASVPTDISSRCQGA